MSRKRLPKQPALVLDEKFINLLRYRRLFTSELEKPQKELIHFTSMMAELRDIDELVVERLTWLVESQYPRTHFLWGALKRFKKLPDTMPKKEQVAWRRYIERNGI